jgi:hypothetical protein
LGTCICPYSEEILLIQKNTEEIEKNNKKEHVKKIQFSAGS